MKKGLMALCQKNIVINNKFDDDIEKKIVDITSSNPRSFNLGFSTWSLRVLAGFIMYDLNGR
jgi:hypothetical protein